MKTQFVALPAFERLCDGYRGLAGAAAGIDSRPQASASFEGSGGLRKLRFADQRSQLSR